MVVQHGDRTLSPGFFSILLRANSQSAVRCIPIKTTRRRIRYRSRHWKTFRRDDGRVQKYHIVEEDEAVEFTARISQKPLGRRFLSAVFALPTTMLSIFSIVVWWGRAWLYSG